MQKQLALMVAPSHSLLQPKHGLLAIAPCQRHHRQIDQHSQCDDDDHYDHDCDADDDSGAVKN